MTETISVQSDLVVKDAVRKRDENLCRDCRITEEEWNAKMLRIKPSHVPKKLDVHRLVPDSKYTMQGCVTLCRRCHRKRHARPKGPRRKQFNFRLSKEGRRLLSALIDFYTAKIGLGKPVSRTLIFERALKELAKEKKVKPKE